MGCRHAGGLCLFAHIARPCHRSAGSWRVSIDAHEFTFRVGFQHVVLENDISFAWGCSCARVRFNCCHAWRFPLLTQYVPHILIIVSVYVHVVALHAYHSSKRVV